MPCVVGVSVIVAYYIEAEIDSILMHYQADYGTLFFIPELYEKIIGDLVDAGGLNLAVAFENDSLGLGSIWKQTGLFGREAAESVSRWERFDIISTDKRRDLGLPSLDLVNSVAAISRLNIGVAKLLGARFLTFDDAERKLAEAIKVLTLLQGGR